MLTFKASVGETNPQRKEELKMKKSRFYVGVRTKDGMRFVTRIDYRNKISYWEKGEAPKQMSMHNAEDLAYCLCCNGFKAVVVKSQFEITGHFTAWRKPRQKKAQGEGD